MLDYDKINLANILIMIMMGPNTQPIYK